MMATELTTTQPGRLRTSRTIVWRDDRNAAHHAEFLDAMTRYTERHADRVLRAMPVFPDAPDIIIPTDDIWMSERRLVFADELAFADELRRLGGLEGFQSASAAEDQKAPGQLIAPCWKNVCGPDVTVQLKNVVHHAQMVYASWSEDEREEHCGALVDVSPGSPWPAAAWAWDIPELKDSLWLKLYQPTCATSPACDETVQIGGECHYMGSANYVIFGVMYKLCGGNSNGVTILIHAYKGGHLPGQTRGGNFDASLAWARAGCDGWPDAPKVSAPPGDRTDLCKPACTIPYGPRPQPGVKLKMPYGRPFTIHWAPHFTG